MVLSFLPWLFTYHSYFSRALPHYTEDRPTLPLLISFPAKDTHLNIPKQLGISYAMLGPLLLQDSTGARVTAIKMQHLGDADLINLAILQKWLAGGGLHPVTWATLTSAIADAGQVAMAEQIKKAVLL